MLSGIGNVRHALFSAMIVTCYRAYFGPAVVYTFSTTFAKRKDTCLQQTQRSRRLTFP